MPSKRFKSCVLHIGTEKTGSTAIQHYLIENRNRLAKHGVLFPIAESATHTSQWEFVAIAHQKPWIQDVGRELEIKNAEQQARFKQELEAKLDAEFRATSADTLLISSEHFQSRLSKIEEIETLKKYLERWTDDFEIIVYFRRQDELALSLLSTRIKSSAPIDVENILSTMKKSPRYYAYDEIFERWASVFGLSSMAPRIYEQKRWPDGDLIADFCEAASIPMLPHVNKRYNLSLNRKGFHFIHSLNKQFAERTDRASQKERLRLVRLISDRHAGKYYPISRQQAESFYQSFGQINQRLQSLAFENEPAPLFSEDFSMYPTNAEPSFSSYDEAVELAIELWNSDASEPEKRFWRKLSDKLLRR